MRQCGCDRRAMAIPYCKPLVRHPEALGRRSSHPSRLLPTWHFEFRNRITRFRLGRRWHGRAASILRGPRFARAPQDDGTKVRASSSIPAMPPHPSFAAPSHSQASPEKEGRRSAKRRTSGDRIVGCGRASLLFPPPPAREDREGMRSPFGAPPRLSPEAFTPSGSASGHASWDAAPAGVTHLHLSQSRDCTSRAGRSTGVTDAQSRPGAGRNPARKHRPRSAFRSTLAKAPFVERDKWDVTTVGTDVKSVSPSP
jgi:hypothetical protein